MNREINKDSFGELLAEAKTACGQDLRAEAEYIYNRMWRMEPGQILRFHFYLHKYADMAYKYGLWSAAAVMTQGCSDDGFIDFRAWLIAQGQDVYLAALKEPDSLAGVETYGHCAFESLCYVADMAYEKKTGRSAYDETPPKELREELDALEKEIVYAADIHYPLEWDEVAGRLPRLCAKHLPPERLEVLAQQGPMWNLTVREIRAAREQAHPRQSGNPSRKKKDNCR